jgi:hypothetical protein
MSFTLVLLAAGVGSRYGGPKQIDPVGPGGATLIDYAAFDAWRVGCAHVVLVVRSDNADEVRRSVGGRLETRLRVDYAVQDQALPTGFVTPPGRTKPWGTGHALVAATPYVEGPFAVLNADDFYGAGSYRILSEWLGLSPPPAEHALVSFGLRATLSPAGPVNRGVCRVDADGFVREIREVLQIVPDGEGARHPASDGSAERLAGDTPVSLNFWGFAPGIARPFRAAFDRFLGEHGGSPTAELFIPTVVQGLVDAGEARVRVLRGGGPWAGLTYPEDRAHLAAVLEERTRAGEYPRELWR